VEGYRSYPDDRPSYREGIPPEPDYPESSGWYAERSYREPERYDDPRAADPATRMAHPGPVPRPSPGPAPTSGSGPAPAPTGSAGVPGGSTAPWSGDEPPAPRRAPVAPASPGPASDGVYRSKRPATAALIGVPAAILELPVLFMLSDAMFADPIASASGVVAGICLVLALPLLAVGMYAVATGAVRAAGPNSAQAWLRPPVAYLSVALILFVAAGLAG